MTVDEIARMLKLNSQTVRNWIDRGELPAVRVGRRVRIRRQDFNAMIDAGYNGPSRPPAPTEGTIWDGVVPPPQMP